MTPVNESLGSGDSARSLRQALGDALYSAGDRLAEGGGVLEVRVLQGGQIVTGIVGGDSASKPPSPETSKSASKYRVYIRGAQRECSCGARGVCVHVAAVSIVAARTGGGAPARGAGTGARVAPASAGVALGAQVGPAQQLCYLLEVEGGPLRGIRVSVWVAQRGTGVGSIVPGSACAFALRRASIASAFEFPRYVDQADREILPVLPEGALGSSGIVDAHCVYRTGVFGGAGGQPLRAGPARSVTLVWKTLADGDQVLGWEGEQEVLLGVEPPAYVDADGGVVGGVELAYGVELAREMARLGAVGPELVGEVNGRIERAGGGSAELAGEGASSA